MNKSKFLVVTLALLVVLIVVTLFCENVQYSMYKYTSESIGYTRLEDMAEQNYQQQLIRIKGQIEVDEFLHNHVNYPCLYGTIPVGDESRKSVVDGHKYICGYDKIIGSPIVYSYGSNQNQIFEQALLKLRPDSKIFVFDISEEKLPIKELRDKKISYIPIALGGYQNKSVNFLTLKDMMKKNKHTYIDVLKMDIEAAEYDWLKYEGDLLHRIGQLSVELHINDQVRSWYPPLNTKMITWFVSTVESYGHRMFYKEINRMVQDCCSEFSFIQSKFMAFEKSKFLNSAL